MTLEISIICLWMQNDKRLPSLHHLARGQDVGECSITAGLKFPRSEPTCFFLFRPNSEGCEGFWASIRHPSKKPKTVEAPSMPPQPPKKPLSLCTAGDQLPPAAQTQWPSQLVRHLHARQWQLRKEQTRAMASVRPFFGCDAARWVGWVVPWPSGARWTSGKEHGQEPRS